MKITGEAKRINATQARFSCYVCGVRVKAYGRMAAAAKRHIKAGKCVCVELEGNVIVNLAPAAAKT